MKLSEAQQQVDNWIKTFGVRYFNEMTNLALLMEETGELARIMARHFGEQSAKPGEKSKGMEEELADILFVLICIANQAHIDLTEAFKKTLEKKTSRDHSRHQENSKLKEH